MDSTTPESFESLPSSGASTPPPPVATPTVAPVTPSAARGISGSDKIWAILSHLSCLVGVWFIIPIVIYLAMRGESTYVSENAKEALNFHISLLIYVLCALPLAFLLIGIPVLVAIGVGSVILSIVAAIKASDGAVYRYPLTIRLVK